MIKLVKKGPQFVLKQNLNRLGQELDKYCGAKVAILGQPGAGKSSMLLKMTGGNIFPRPIVGIQTDATTWAEDLGCPLLSIYYHYAFVDVPGYDTKSHPLDVMVSGFPFAAVDAYIFLISGKLHASDINIYRSLAQTGKPVCIARSFSDTLGLEEKHQVVLDLRASLNLDRSVPVVFFSNRTGRGVQPLLEWIRIQFSG
jgi:GTPase Era involved in 16S rRNA processing